MPCKSVGLAIRCTMRSISLRCDPMHCSAGSFDSGWSFADVKAVAQIINR
jgi:hypothetical protein